MQFMPHQHGDIANDILRPLVSGGRLEEWSYCRRDRHQSLRAGLVEELWTLQRRQKRCTQGVIVDKQISHESQFYPERDDDQ